MKGFYKELYDGAVELLEAFGIEVTADNLLRAADLILKRQIKNAYLSSQWGASSKPGYTVYDVLSEINNSLKEIDKSIYAIYKAV